MTTKQIKDGIKNIQKVYYFCPIWQSWAKKYLDDKATPEEASKAATAAKGVGWKKYRGGSAWLHKHSTWFGRGTEIESAAYVLANEVSPNDYN